MELVSAEYTGPLTHSRAGIEEQTAASADGSQQVSTAPVRPQPWSAREFHWIGRHVCFGRIEVFRVTAGWALFIGPHWYCSLLMLSVILASGTAWMYYFGLALGPAHTLVGFLATVLSTVLFLRCFLADPGILTREPVRAPPPPPTGQRVQIAPSQGRTHCDNCQLLQPAGALHCEFCLVCIDSYDHHCPWMGKCIGKKNLASFHQFLYGSMASLLYIVSTALVAHGHSAGD